MPAVMLAVVAVAGCRQPATDIPPATAAVTAPATDPLPSWREGANKQAILEYVRAVTTDGGPAYIPPASRFAIFDNDGTLWAEQPIVQLEFVAARIAALAREERELAASPAVKALLARDLAFFHGKDGEKHAMELLALSSTGMSCPMNCPKQLRNGPCGGVRANGNCEVEPGMPCVWVKAWEGSRNMVHGDRILNVQKPVDQSLRETSAWLRVTAQAAAEKETLKKGV